MQRGEQVRSTAEQGLALQPHRESTRTRSRVRSAATPRFGVLCHLLLLWRLSLVPAAHLHRRHCDLHMFAVFSCPRDMQSQSAPLQDCHGPALGTTRSGPLRPELTICGTDGLAFAGPVSASHIVALAHRQPSPDTPHSATSCPRVRHAFAGRRCTPHLHPVRPARHDSVARLPCPPAPCPDAALEPTDNAFKLHKLRALRRKAKLKGVLLRPDPDMAQAQPGVPISPCSSKRSRSRDSTRSNTNSSFNTPAANTPLATPSVSTHSLIIPSSTPGTPSNGDYPQDGTPYPAFLKSSRAGRQSRR